MSEASNEPEPSAGLDVDVELLWSDDPMPVQDALDSLPDGRTPTPDDWSRLARGWRDNIDHRIAELEALRDELGDCIGCGCLSLKSCALFNPEDRAGASGTGARYIVGDPRPEPT